MDHYSFYPSLDTKWNYKQKVSIQDIKIWQQLYYIAGGIGVYVAHVPRIEFYMITYNVFINKEMGIETFYGSCAVEEVISKTRQLGIQLPIEIKKINQI